MDLRILFVHPMENECDSFRRACLDEDFKVDTCANTQEAEKFLEEYTYEMVFVNRKLGGEEITDFIRKVKAVCPDIVSVIGVQTLTKADMLHYQNQDGFYHMYLEPANYRTDLLPMIETVMLEAKARVIGQINQGVKESEERWNEFQDLIVSMIPDNRDGIGKTYAMNVLRHYHKMSMQTVNRVSELQKEIETAYANHKELTIQWDIKENAKRILEYTDAEGKLFMARMMCMVACSESAALSGGYQVTLTISLGGHREGVHIATKAMISGDRKPDEERSRIIERATDGIYQKICVSFGKNEDQIAGMWVHNREGVFGA